MNILFTCAGRRNYLVNYFKEELKGRGKVFAADLSKTAPALAEADVAILVPEVGDPEYIDVLENIIAKHNINAVISLNDLELPILSANRDRLGKHGCRLIVSNEKVIDTCFDKLKTVEFVKKLNIKTPKTFTSIKDVVAALDRGEIDFPLVVKPRWGSSSIGLEFPEDKTELKLAYQLLNYRLDRTILSGISASDRDRAIIIQEKIEGSEYGLDIINDLDGNHKAVIVKKKLSMRAGETDKAMTVDQPDLKNYGKMIGEALGHFANLDCDFFEDSDGDYYLLEMNPRFGGGYPFSHEAGANLPGAILSWLQGEAEPDKCFIVELNAAFSKCDRLIRVNV